MVVNWKFEKWFGIFFLWVCLYPESQAWFDLNLPSSFSVDDGVSPECKPPDVAAETKWITVSYTTYTLEKTGGSWWRRTKYSRRAKTAWRDICAPGYDGPNCQAMCHGEAHLGACNRDEGYIEYLDGDVVECSGGACVRPDVCTHCNEGYYSASDGYCRACNPIADCMVPTCTSNADETCKLCRSEFNSEKAGSNAFIGNPSNRHKCERACSWRHGYRCYPGTCSNHMLFSSCSCFNGFSGTDCRTLSTKPTINLKEIGLKHTSVSTLFLPDPSTTGKLWTKVMDWETIDVKAGAVYSFEPGSPPSYITNIEIGITDVDVNLILKRGGKSNNWGVNFNTRCRIKGVNLNSCQLSTTKNFRREAQWRSLMNFRHEDTLVFTVIAFNGGFVNYQDLEDNNRIGRYDIDGQSTSVSFELGFDDQSPRHCYMYEAVASCNDAPLVTPDFVDHPTLTVLWAGWSDGDSGMHKYEISVIQLRANGELLDFGETKQIIRVDANQLSHDITLPASGPYSIQLTAIDNAGNVKHTRRVLLYDDSSIIETHGNTPVVMSADSSTNYEWINKMVTEVEVAWPGRFINKVVSTGKWLNEIKGDDSIPRELDDSITVSKRNTSAIDNVDGIVKFEIGYDVFYDGNSQFISYVGIPSEYFHMQKMFISETLLDGMRLQFYIRAYDAMDKYLDDVINVTCDFSPPVIKDLWLTKGDRLNITVHNLLELNEITFEWIAYDSHSGLSSISWRLFDNYTDIVHGHSPLGHQGNSQAEDDCKSTYGSYPRGADCYCTPFDGCFHRHFQSEVDCKLSFGSYPRGTDCYCTSFHDCFHKHFQVQPEISMTGEDGIHTDRVKGVHDGDYFIEIKAQNRAKLESVHTLQITLDTSPPHQGHVHDGVPGEPDIDYQTSSTLHAHWSGFFDRESGVLFYKYGFEKQCLTAEHFILDTPKNLVLTETYTTAASFEASDNGTYFITVAAYNRALDPSDPVCSDGVTIDTVVPSISEVVVKDAKTTRGLFKDDTDNVWLLHHDRVVEKIDNPSAACSNKATPIPVQILSLYPKQRTFNGTESVSKGTTICNSTEGAHLRFVSYVTSDTNLVMSWNVTEGISGIFDYEVGLASTMSTIPDMMDFISSHGHQHIRIHHPNIWDGSLFHVVIKTIAKSSMTKTQVLGPFVVSKMSPEFSGSITVNYEETEGASYLIVKWGSSDFEDHGDPTPLSYLVAVGTGKQGSTSSAVTDTTVNILPFTELSAGGSCTATQHPTCAALDLSVLPWQLHANHEYYVSIKAENAIGLFTIATSSVYKHDVTMATGGLIFDVKTNGNIMFEDIIDIDFQTSTDKLAAEWSGFHHPYQAITYKICYTVNPDIVSNCVDVGEENHYTFYGLNLTPFQTYYQVVIASTSAGDKKVVSDGVTIVQEDAELSGVEVFDGLECNGTGIESILTSSHHKEDKRTVCITDIDYQVSTNGLSAHWIIPTSHRKYTTDVYWAVEERAPVIEHWSQFKDYEHIKTSSNVQARELVLQAGVTYRLSVKLCAGVYCYKPVASNGVTVVPNPPDTGSISVQFDSNENKITVEFERFYDADIEDLKEKYSVMDHYEWALTDDSLHGKILSNWSKVVDSMENELKVTFMQTLSAEVEFTKCWRVSVRGYTKVGLSSVVGGDLQDCEDYTLVRPSSVIDAIGDPITVDGVSRFSHDGQPISLKENDIWTDSDVDYTPYRNIISAVWPQLRYKHYAWAVLHYKENDPVVFYKQTSDLQLTDPCSLPEAIKCGETDAEYMNALFINGELVHGQRYIVCIHANATTIQYEDWTLNLEAISTCSDGVTVDLTPPTAGRVWIGTNPTVIYQSSSTDMSINWDSFVDVEESGHAVHSSGIAKYEVALGSAYGGVDISDYVDVGIRNHFTFHGIKLQNGHTYFASVRAYDFTGQTETGVSTGVKVDVTPPIKSLFPITIDKRHITDTNFVRACWDGVFSDLESGISSYSWAVGSQPGYDDMVNFTDSIDVCAQSDENSPVHLEEGHSYYVSVKAYNGIGLSSLAISWAFTVDASPPIAGHVFDGQRGGSYKQHKDVDYVADSTLIYVYWEGFHDPHTPIHEYIVQVGSCENCDDVLSQQPVGFDTEIELPQLRLIEGMNYFVSVTACNVADLCTTVSSDGFVLDRSPPSPGRVLDGTQGHDIMYQASRIYLGAAWYGFSDPQSGLSHYEWRAGTSPRGDDILVSTEVHLEEKAFIADLTWSSGTQLPVLVPIFITVVAYNKAGMPSEAVSNGFIVDITPPYFEQELRHVWIGSAVPGTSVSRTFLRVEWQVEDPESFIDQQYLSISAHVGGEFNISSIKVEGIVRDYTFTGLELHDGCYYDVTLQSCNGARLCSRSQILNILVDGSPPTPGMFAVNTEHAVKLDREPNGYMTWSILSVKLSWLGFEDFHSGISYYIINIGSTFMGNDLNKDQGVPYKIPHSLDGTDHDEGKIQVAELPTQSMARLEKPPTIYISMYAVNGVGQPSPMIQSQFELLSGGLMELKLLRRCNAHTCYGHCVCAPHGEVCLHSDSSCIQYSDSNPNQLVTVSDYIDLTFPTNSLLVQFSPINDMLAACWKAETTSGKPFQWFEWSVGETIYSTPKGVFSEVHDRVWHDAGQRNCVFYVLPRGKLLKERDKYSVFVRAWYSAHEFAVFKSPGVIVYTTAPKITVLLGRQVKERLAADKDIDFIDKSTTFYIDWTNKFLNTNNGLSKFHVYLSTYPGGHDVHILSKDLPADVTSISLSASQLSPGVKFYAVVQAYNSAGLHTTETSDGFIIDAQPPLTGIVLDGKGVHDIQVQMVGTKVWAFWYGFKDLDSGILKFEACLSYHDALGQCHLSDFVDVGISTSVEFELETTLYNGAKVVTEVRATDAAGLISDTVSSDGVLIDLTGPVRENRTTLEENIISNPSFETAEQFIDITNLTADSKCSDETLPGWNTTDSSCLFHVYDENGSANDGKYFIIISGIVSQKLSAIEVGNFYRVQFYSSHIDFDSATISSKFGVLAIDEEKHTFVLYSKPKRHDVSKKGNAFSWHKHTFYFQGARNTSTLTIGTVGTATGLAIDSVSIQKVIVSSNQEALPEGHVQGHTYFLHDWSSVHATWNFIDPQSSIKEYLWAIGTVRGGTQLQTFKSVGKHTYATLSSVTLLHDSVVHITVIAINYAGIRTVSYSDPILVDLSGPLISNIIDGEKGIRTVSYSDPILVDLTGPLISNIIDGEKGIRTVSYSDPILVDLTGPLISNIIDGEKGIRTVSYSDPILVDLTGPVISNIIDGEKGIRTVSYSDPILVDLTGPLISSIIDGEKDVDLDYQRTNHISVKWSVEDPESGVASCLWAIGHHKGDTTLQNYTLVDNGATAASAEINVDLHGLTVYVTIKCFNGAGLSTIASSDGVTILYNPPSTDTVILEVLGSSTTQYLVQGNYHGNRTAINFRWTGFDESEGIDSYLATLTGPDDFSEEEIVKGYTKGFVYASFQNLNLTDGVYEVAVIAINELKMYSQKAKSEFILLTQPPIVTETEVSITWNTPQRDIIIDWSDTFSTIQNGSVFYEVTVRIKELANGDVLQWQETRQTSLILSLDNKSRQGAGFTVIATIRAISYCGLFTTLQKEKYLV